MNKANRLRLGAVGVFLLAVLGVGTWLAGREEAVETASWGLSVPHPGESPVGNATAEELAAYDAAFVGDGSKKVLCLTFDAGYENGHTEAILDVPAKHQAPAAFFVVGTYIEQHPELVKRMAAEKGISCEDRGRFCVLPSMVNRIARLCSFKATIGQKIQPRIIPGVMKSVVIIISRKNPRFFHVPQM